MFTALVYYDNDDTCCVPAHNNIYILYVLIGGAGAEEGGAPVNRIVQS